MFYSAFLMHKANAATDYLQSMKMSAWREIVFLCLTFMYNEPRAHQLKERYIKESRRVLKGELFQKNSSQNNVLQFGLLV